MTRRVAVLFGGVSPEHEVSVTSARSVLGNLDPALWTPVPVAIGKDGTWLGPDESHGLLSRGAHEIAGGGESPLQPGPALAALAGADVVFPVVHGTFGEDGTLQGMLEMLDRPYTGCGVAASAIGMDKGLMNALFREAGLPQPRYLVVREHDLAGGRGSAERAVEEELGYPVFVKPANGGSSVGVSKVHSREDLGAAFDVALAFDRKILVEAAVRGREVECSVLGNEEPEASVVGEIVPDREFYSYDSKYSADSKTELRIPAPIEQDASDRVRELAIRMYSVMGCEGYARVDFFLACDGTVLGNEINTIPGFTTISMYPKLWEASGISYRDLLTRIIHLGLERHARRRRP